MSNYLEVNEKIKKQAVSWYTLYQSGFLTEEEKDHLDEWLNEDPRHQYEYDMLAETWLNLDELENHPEFQELLEESEEKVYWLDNVFQKMTANRLWGTAIAASVLTVAFLFLPNSEKDTSYSVDIGERQSIEIYDGINIELNSNSQLIAHAQTDGRTLTLVNGHAFIDIDSESTNLNVGLVSFIARNSKVDIQSVDGKHVFTVIDGDITFQNESSALPNKLSKGQMLVFNPELDSSYITKVNIDKTMAWRRGILHFDQQPLSEAVSEFNRYLENKIEIENEALEEVLVSGKFEIRDVDNFLSTLTNLAPLEVSSEHGKRTLHAI